MTEYLSRRDHSEKELRTKLSKFYSAEEIQIAIEYGKSRKWIPDTPEEKLEFSKKVADTLRRRGKGINYINKYLKEKGLPSITSDAETELNKAVELIRLKFQKQIPAITNTEQTREVYHEKAKIKAKAIRFLLSRGYSPSQATKAVQLAFASFLTEFLTEF